LIIFEYINKTMKEIFVDFDNTLCRTQGKDYVNSTPILERIEFINNLKKQGNKITIWTARGSVSKTDYTELTASQLKKWNVNYDNLLLGKPHYDIYLDDKSFNIETILPVPEEKIVDGKALNITNDYYHNLYFLFSSLLCKVTNC
jgi:hypothetical protein